MADTIDKSPVFKPAKPSPRDKAEQTTLAARAIMDAEVAARDKKTERLRQMRLAQEASAAEAPAPAEKRGKTSAPAKAASKRK